MAYQVTKHTQHRKSIARSGVVTPVGTLCERQCERAATVQLLHNHVKKVSAVLQG